MSSNKTVTAFQTVGARSAGKFHIKDGRSYGINHDTHCGIIVPRASSLGIEMSLDDPRLCKTCLRLYLKKTGYRV